MHIDGGTMDVYRPRSLIRAALFALTLLCVPAAQAGEDAPYPVWWSPELGLESLDHIVGEIARDFPLGDQFHLVTIKMERVYKDILIDEAHPELGYNWDSKAIILSEHWISYCPSLIEWNDKGFDIDHDSRYWRHALQMRNIYAARCYSLLALKQARPATTSHVRDFVLDQDAMSYIPSMVAMSWTCNEIYSSLENNRDGVSWKDYFFDFYKENYYRHVITVLDENSIYVDLLYKSKMDYPESYTTTKKLTIYGRGDFNGDGMDDILLKWDEIHRLRIGDPTIRYSAMYLVTRYNRDDVLRVVDFYGPPPAGGVKGCDAKKLIIEWARPE